jgi:hypothetical protein
MHWHKKLLVCSVYPVLLLFFSVVSASLINHIIGGPPGTVRLDDPFLLRCAAGAFFMCWILLYKLWYVFLLFGVWVAFFPPRGWFSWIAILLAAVAVGLLASHVFQPFHPWETELENHDLVSPPPGPTAIYANLLSCVTALLSITVCCLAIKRWFNHPPSINVV